MEKTLIYLEETCKELFGIPVVVVTGIESFVYSYPNLSSFSILFILSILAIWAISR